jgi:hypothetical protein
MSIIIGIGPESGRMPPALEKTEGSFDAAMTASYDASPHTPLRSSKYTGAFVRIHSYFGWGSST